MIDQYFLVLTTIDLFVLTFMCILTKLSETLNSKQKRGFFLAFVLIGVISILEVITILVDGAPVHLRWLNILSNYLGFGLSPAVSLCLVYVLDKKQGVRRGFKTAVACEAAYLISLALMLPGGMVFSVSEENLYSRGDFFAFYVTAYFAALVYLAACTAITARVFQNRSRVLIYPLIVFLAAETIIQIALPQLHVTWLCVTLLSVLYFIYCSEMWNQLDALTGLLNQNSYLNRTAEMRRSGEVLVVFDVDDFKQVNDQYGHVKGDICLAEIAACIKRAYARHGYCYRTGGDEFCVLLRDGDKEHACARDFVRRLSERRKELDFLPSVFVVEQKCCYQEVDDADENAYHVWLRDEDGIEAYARVLPRGATFPEVSIGRVIAVKRRCGLGKQIVAAAIDTAKEKLHADKITIEAQTYVKKLYENFGFYQTSEEFLEDGIPHVQMQLDLTK